MYRYTEVAGQRQMACKAAIGSSIRVHATESYTAISLVRAAQGAKPTLKSIFVAFTRIVVDLSCWTASSRTRGTVSWCIRS